MKTVGKEALTFNDVLIRPKFNFIQSRKDVDIGTWLGDTYYSLPVVSSNMDTVTGPAMCKAMRESGGVGCLHRFWSIEDNVKAFLECYEEDNAPWVSLGLGNKEFERAKALWEVGASTFVLDVAHGAQQSVVEMYNKLEEYFKGMANIIVGNFATLESIKSFEERIISIPAGYKVGIGNGSACTTRIKTGIGVPQLEAILECAESGRFIIADGGMKTPGDIAKAFAAGAHMVMLGGMLAGTDENPGHEPGRWLVPVGTPIDTLNVAVGMHAVFLCPPPRIYRGSASKESYEVQGKDDAWRTAEGESFTVIAKGPVKSILNDIEGGLRSAFTYVGAHTLERYYLNTEFVRITNSGYQESVAHFNGTKKS